MRPLLITDGVHLKGTYKGTNLVLVGMDGNNQIVPIATGVPQGETGKSWTWFLLKFKECIGKVSNLAIHKVMDRMQKSSHLKVLRIDYGRLYQVDDHRRVHQVDLTFRTCTCRKWQLLSIPCGHVIAVSRKMGCTDCSHLALGWFRKTIFYSTYQDLVYPVREPSSWVRPDGLQVVKPLNMNFHTAGRPKNIDRIKSQGEEPIQGAVYVDTTERHAINQLQIIKLKRSRQTMQESNIHVDLGGHSQEYEAAYTNNYMRSQEYKAAHNNNFIRSQEYEAAYTNNYVRSQEYEVAYTNNYVSTQEYEATYDNMDGGSQGYRSTYNNMNGSSQGYEAAYTNFNIMFEQANINFGGQSQQPLPTMPFTFSQFNLGQSLQQTYSTWDSSWDPINFDDP
nr:hypothetical protein [Tanacetum cinerariifolium]